MHEDRILQVAAKYIGQIEKQGNLGFNDPTFEAAMKAVGWQPSQSWCAYFCELVWKEAVGKQNHLWKVCDKLFSASATATYANFASSKLFTTGKAPKPASLAVWRYGNDWRGHIGIVESVGAGQFVAIEGNTNAAGSREGMFVMRKTRKLGEPFKAKGLNLIGFVYAP